MSQPRFSGQPLGFWDTAVLHESTVGDHFTVVGGPAYPLSALERAHVEDASAMDGPDEVVAERQPVDDRARTDGKRDRVNRDQQLPKELLDRDAEKPEDATDRQYVDPASKRARDVLAIVVAVFCPDIPFLPA
jgi:hypothetical protein